MWQGGSGLSQQVPDQPRLSGWPWLASPSCGPSRRRGSGPASTKCYGTNSPRLYGDMPKLVWHYNSPSQEEANIWDPNEPCRGEADTKKGKES